MGLRIIGVTDAIDAITSISPYRKAMSWEECWDEVLLNKGRQFDPMAVEKAEKLRKRWKGRYQETQKDSEEVRVV